MEPRRSTFISAIFAQVMILLFLQSVQHAIGFEEMKCVGAKDGTSDDAPCELDVYLGSLVSIDCNTAVYTTTEPAFLSKSGGVCTEKFGKHPTTCPKDKVKTWAQLGLAEVYIAPPVITVPFTRGKELTAPTKVYARCAKNPDEALYVTMNLIPRPKFPDAGRLVSCMSLVVTAGKTCDLTAGPADTAVFECPPAKAKPVLVPAQSSDRAHVCASPLSTADAACSSATDLGGDGVTLTYLKTGSDVRSASFKSPDSGSKKVEGYLNCKATGETSFYKYALDLSGKKYTMPKTYKVCDPADGAKQDAPCSADLKAGEAYVVNCSLMPKTAPADLMKSDGMFCTKALTADAADMCADSTGKWSEVGAEVFMNASNLVIHHKKTDLAKEVTAYGKCYDGATASYFKIMFAAGAGGGSGGSTTAPTSTTAPGSHATTQTSSVGVIFGVLGSVLLATEALWKI